MSDPLEQLLVETPTQPLTDPPTLAAWWRDNQGAQRWAAAHKSLLGDLVAETTRRATAAERERLLAAVDIIELELDDNLLWDEHTLFSQFRKAIRDGG